MAKPPPSGPHSDIAGVNRDARVNSPTTDPRQGSATEIDQADKNSAGHPDEGSVPTDKQA